MMLTHHVDDLIGSIKRLSNIMNETVKELMQTAVKVIGPEETLLELQRAFQEAGVSGFPVVDREGRLIGIVSRSDIGRQLGVEQSMAEYISDYYREVRHFESNPGESLAGIGERLGRRLEELRVKDVMIGKVISVTPDTSLTELAQTLIRHHIHRLPVCDQGRLVGIVSTLDLVRLFAEQRASLS
jgi:CBS domain-containing protein